MHVVEIRDTNVDQKCDDQEDKTDTAKHRKQDVEQLRKFLKIHVIIILGTPCSITASISE